MHRRGGHPRGGYRGGHSRGGSHTAKTEGRGWFHKRPPTLRQAGFGERRPRIEGDIDGIMEVVLPNNLLEYKRQHPDSEDPDEPKTELEVRFSYGIEYPITARLFHAVKDEIIKNWKLTSDNIVEEITQVENYGNNVRKITDENGNPLLDANGESVGEQKSYQNKKDVDTSEEKTYLSPDYPYKVVLATERYATQDEINKKGIRTRHAIRKRTSYLLGAVRVDCTVVKDLLGEKRAEYQIEMEILDAGEGEESTNSIRDEYLAPLLLIILETPILYTLKTLNALKNLPPFRYYDQGSKFLSADKPEDLRLHELSTLENGLVATEEYCVTIKTDGLRKLFFVFRDSIYLVGVYSGNTWSFSRVYRKEGMQLGMQGTLIDCELIEDYGVDEDGNALTFYSENAHYNLWAFDLLAYRRTVASEKKGEPDREELVITTQTGIPFFSSNETLESRYGILKRRCSQISGKRFTLNCKHFIPCYGPERFFSACRETLDNEYPFGTDGLIFTNSLRPYTTVVADERIMNVSYNRKWKPIKKLTLDLLLATDSRGKRVLQIIDYGNLLPFRGTNTFPWNGVFIDELHGIKLEDGQIVEFAYLAEGENINDDAESADDAVRRLIPIKRRPDKDKPSNKKAAEDVWTLLHEPIRVKTIRGESYQLMRKYDNQLKNNLLTELPEHSKDLDGGSGQGGDLKKWSDNKLRVVGLEVDPVQRKRFNERLAAIYANKKKKKIVFDPQDIVLEEFGIDDEQLEEKYPDRFDSATMFFVITFLRGESLVRFADNMERVIKSGGKLYILGFDARMFASKLLGYEDSLKVAQGDIRKLKLEYESEATIFHINGDLVDLHLKGTLVGTPERLQREFAIDYDELILLLEARGFHVDENSFATEETFLGEDENKYTQSTRILRLSKGVDTNTLLSIADLKLPALPAVNSIRYTMTDPETNEVEVEEEEGLLPLGDYLKPGVESTFDYLGYNLVRIGVPDDSNCFLHAACRALSQAYVEMKPRERTTFVRDLRVEMANNLTQEEFNKLGNGGVAAIYTLDSFKDLLTRRERVDGVLVYQWLGEEVFDLFERTFDVEIIMLWYIPGEGMIPGTAASHAKQYDKTIILLNLGNIHYETIALVAKKQLWTCFKSNHPLVNLLRDRLNKETEKQRLDQSSRVEKIAERVKSLNIK